MWIVYNPVSLTNWKFGEKDGGGGKNWYRMRDLSDKTTKVMRETQSNLDKET